MPRNSILTSGTGAARRKIFTPTLKILLAFIYVCFAVSFPKYDMAGIMMFASLPLAALIASSKDIFKSLKNSLAAVPIALVIGAANLWFERATMLDFGIVKISAGEISLAVLCAKAWACAAAAVAFSQCASESEMAKGLAALKIPCPIALQISLTMRYIPIIAEQAREVLRAYSLRSAHASGAAKITDWPKLAGSLLLRSLDRASNIYSAMRARGFEAKCSQTTRGQIMASDILISALFVCVCAAFKILSGEIFI